jgi:hypothetical protein
MSSPLIVLGTGRPTDDQSGNTVLDVHLHLDHPESPISMGETWGRQTTGAGYTLREAAESRNEPHLRACGCEWLLLVATEERLRGRLFTPEEILARRPASTPISPPPPPTKRAKPTAPDALPKIRAAIEKQNFEALEGLRDVLNDELVHQVAADWSADLPWSVKDAYAALLMDQTAECVRPIFQDALRSPTPESRAYAVCVLTGDFSRFEAMITDGGVDEAKVDAMIRTLPVPSSR